MKEPSPHSRDWYERLAERQQGYFYPWRSTVDPGGGEAEYDALIDRHLGSTLDLLDVGCGHGEDVLRFAAHVRSATGYDQVGAFIELAKAHRIKRSIPNARFVVGSSSTTANGGRPRLPMNDQSIDVFVCRRGPASWIADVRRVGQPGAVILQLEAAGGRRPIWADQIPESLRTVAAREPEDLELRVRAVAERVAGADCKLEFARVHAVAEHLAAPDDLYAFLTFGREPSAVPRFEQVRESLTSMFDRHRGAKGLEIQNCRILWKARV